MGRTYARTMFREAARRLQQEHGSRASYERLAERGPVDDALSEAEIAFVGERDSFYLATVTEDGWPYIQHRGGPKGFLRVLGPRLLAFADFAGNKQYISTGNFATDDRVSLFLMDYRNQARLKILGHARVVAPGAEAALDAAVISAEYPARVERLVRIEVVAFDWNCPPAHHAPVLCSRGGGANGSRRDSLSRLMFLAGI